ncbi:hypothetical protein C8F04DRAFT_1192120 [Mycena alexandri]|uniref:Uncharacterized protein n=1 Tax=Mycena alexandri TaxID=1745969 RepID=A0AAD6WXE2_9AGAR|nr:hypothetical protein C8F04DRAFT_1192120 [Mycena alexandri]
MKTEGVPFRLLSTPSSSLQILEASREGEIAVRRARVVPRTAGRNAQPFRVTRAALGNPARGDSTHTAAASARTPSESEIGDYPALASEPAPTLARSTEYARASSARAPHHNSQPTPRAFDTLDVCGDGTHTHTRMGTASAASAIEWVRTRLGWGGVYGGRQGAKVVEGARGEAGGGRQATHTHLPPRTQDLCATHRAARIRHSMRTARTGGGGVRESDNGNAGFPRSEPAAARMCTHSAPRYTPATARA